MDIARRVRSDKEIITIYTTNKYYFLITIINYAFYFNEIDNKIKYFLNVKNVR